jgi:hypothetical protein
VLKVRTAAGGFRTNSGTRYGTALISVPCSNVRDIATAAVIAGKCRRLQHQNTPTSRTHRKGVPSARIEGPSCDRYRRIDRLGTPNGARAGSDKSGCCFVRSQSFSFARMQRRSWRSSEFAGWRVNALAPGRLPTHISDWVLEQKKDVLLDETPGSRRRPNFILSRPGAWRSTCVIADNLS